MSSSPIKRSVSVKLDEDLPASLAAILVEAGHDVATVFGQGWQGQADEVIWPKLVRENRMLITGDKEFGDIRMFPPGSHAGVVLLRAAEESLTLYCRMIEVLLARFDLAELAGCVVVVSQTHVRVRRPHP